MSPVVYPYLVTNSYKGGLFMRTYSRNVRRAWDGEDYRPPKRLRLNDTWNATSSSAPTINENSLHPLDLEDSLERAIRETSVAALSSSPSRKNSTIFSAAESQADELGSSTITPPSSPPPELQLTPPNVKVRKPTFSCLNKASKDKKDAKPAKRKRDEQSRGLSAPVSTRLDSEPLSEIFNSSLRAQSSQPPTNPDPPQQDVERTAIARPTIQIPRPAPPPKQKLVQTVLDLGQPLLPATCPQCQMSYMPSVPEDAQLHNMYHNRDSSGIELGKPFLKSAMRWCYQVPQIPGSVIVVDRKMALPTRRVVQKVLGIVNKELGSVDIKEEELWSQRVPEGEKDEEFGGKKCDRYKAFLHILDEKCVGICLAERITKAHRVLPSETATSETLPLNGHFGCKRPASPTPTETHEEDQRSISHKPQIPTPVASPTASSPPSSICISEETYPAVVGVSRIWTSKAFRHKGIANNLLECVMNQFIYGLELEPLQLAFSQPTESGAALARAWFGEKDGWAVYRED
ncbi:hypothetical protein G647_10385 [Cladophialophora carrionii CBS 160.54]|uniref:N-acetyltransferase domain-containing protein n=1 Tax=Cladophialophora carrionii CBS 160.54 TaxID=1279043 RepID=V9DI87_9EURO|nr:uncharacterized protein G647_10385 [Cladophialophora carrionii CBS 160.54]ETI26624.1 hypothetical protein G647_10385 [Cladophialophora carrionii CBS 160.54]